VYAGANTHRAQKRIFTCVKGKKRSLSLSLSLSLFCSCRRCCCSNASRVVRFESEEKRKKKKTIRKKFLRAREKAQNILLHTVFDFFSLSLSFSFSPVVVVVVACHHPERERERERCAHLFKNDAPRLSFRETYLRVLSLCSFAAALNIFYSFSSRRESG
jgi:hypothetical protein